MQRRDVLKQLLAICAAAQSGHASGATATADKRLDLDIVRRALELHPGLYRYNSPTDISARLSSLAPKYLDADLPGAYLLLSKFLASIRCGHTYCNFSNQRRPVAVELFDRRTRLPFEFRWMDEAMVVVRPYAQADGIVPGTVVETLNGQPAAELLRQLLPYVRADGANDGKRRALLSMVGTASIETFDVFQGLVAPPTADTHRLEVRAPDGRRRRLDLPTLSLAERRKERTVRATGNEPIWTWSMRDDGVALLTMPDWAMYSSQWKDWRSWLDDRLTSLAGARGLVIDLRANEGGEDVGDEILARLTDRDLVRDDELQKIRFQRTPSDLDPYLDTWDDSFRTLGVNAAALDNGFYARPGASLLTRIAARAPRVDVPVAALIGPTNSSATFQFAQRCQQIGLVRLFGTETGGNRRGINGGAYFFVRLPGSGIEFDLPLVGYFPHTPQPDAGVVPDVVVHERVEDIAAQRDSALDAAVAWARSAQRR